MKQFSAKTRIHATAETIWSILTDAAGYPEWNPTVTTVEGTIAPGDRVTLRPRLNPKRAFPLTVATLDPPRLMVWRGGMPLGLFVGERTFTLTPQVDGTVEFNMREAFRGLLAPLIGMSIPDMQPEFDEFAAALKREAERRGQTTVAIETN